MGRHQAPSATCGTHGGAYPHLAAARLKLEGVTAQLRRQLHAAKAEIQGLKQLLEARPPRPTPPLLAIKPRFDKSNGRLLQEQFFKHTLGILCLP